MVDMPSNQTKPNQVLPLWVRVNSGIMAVKENSTFLKTPGLEPHHLMQFSVIYRTLVKVDSHLFAGMQSGNSPALDLLL